MLLAARALGLGATLTTLYLQFEKEAEAALGLPPGVHSYALLPIGYPMGRFGPVRRVPLADVVYEDRVGRALPGSVATRSTLRHCRNDWRRNLSASIIVVFDPEGRTGCRILTDREVRQFPLRTSVSRTRLVSSSARPRV